MTAKQINTVQHPAAHTYSAQVSLEWKIGRGEEGEDEEVVQEDI